MNWQTRIRESLQASNQWFFQTPLRALEQAYQAAVIIKSIEDQYFDGNKISTNASNYTVNVRSYWQTELDKNLNIINRRLAEFKISRSVANLASPVILEKLKFIDRVVQKYTSTITVANDTVIYPLAIEESQITETPVIVERKKTPSPDEKRGIFPSSIGRVFNRIQTELNPEAEAEVVQKFRLSSKRTKKALRFLVLLLIIPVLTQQLSKRLIIEPIISNIPSIKVPMFRNDEMREAAMLEMHNFEEKLKFQNLIFSTPELSLEERESQLKEKVKEIAEKFKNRSSSTIGNIVADLLGLISFGVIIALSKREIAVLKSFMDEIAYGLSDSAKAFIIILFTDIFVGFHSPHGWEVILEEFANHLGVPAERQFIGIFIATFPVILDTIIKYWIFRYLSRISPSAVATYREMDD
ncbi:MAG: proton extrusion protein PcxA [Nostocaceae cyanobacterium]|nr:proton extrusion protein PcxA [Nostocaceae cyanobacterium]